MLPPNIQEAIHRIPPHARRATNPNRAKSSFQETANKNLYKPTIECGPRRAGTTANERTGHIQRDDQGELVIVRGVVEG